MRFTLFSLLVTCELPLLCKISVCFALIAFFVPLFLRLLLCYFAWLFKRGSDVTEWKWGELPKTREETELAEKKAAAEKAEAGSKETVRCFISLCISRKMKFITAPTVF